MARRKSYRQELNERKKQLQDAIAEGVKKLEDYRMDEQWLEDYRKLNHLRLDLMTVKSRLEHLGKRKKYNGIEIVSININHQHKIDLL